MIADVLDPLLANPQSKTVVTRVDCRHDKDGPKLGRSKTGSKLSVAFLMHLFLIQ